MNMYHTIDDALRAAACSQLNGDIRHRSTIPGKDTREKFSYLCHDVRDCPFKETKGRDDYCLYHETAHKIDQLDAQNRFNRRYSIDTIEKRVKEQLKEEKEKKNDKVQVDR